MSKRNIEDKIDLKTTLQSRNITVMGRRTSVRLEPEMWQALREIAKREKCQIHDICSLIQLRKNPSTSLTAAIRVFIMLYFKAASTNEGHQKAGHGSFGNMLDRAQMDGDLMKDLKKGKLQELQRADVKKKKPKTDNSRSYLKPRRIVVPNYRMQQSIKIQAAASNSAPL